MEPVNCRFICKISSSHVTLRDGTVLQISEDRQKKDHGNINNRLYFWARLGCCFSDFSGFSYLFWRFFRPFRWVWGVVLWISAVSATFFRIFSGCFAVVGELFCGFQRFQLLFSGIFPAFGLDLLRGHWNKTKKRAK